MEAQDNGHLTMLSQAEGGVVRVPCYGMRLENKERLINNQRI